MTTEGTLWPGRAAERATLIAPGSFRQWDIVLEGGVNWAILNPKLTQP